MEENGQRSGAPDKTKGQRIDESKIRKRKVEWSNSRRERKKSLLRKRTNTKKRKRKKCRSRKARLMCSTT
jgi:hypothetical protein